MAPPTPPPTNAPALLTVKKLLSSFVHFAFIQAHVVASLHVCVRVCLHAPAGNKVAAITRQALCPLAVDRRCLRVCVCVYTVSRPV